MIVLEKWWSKYNIQKTNDKKALIEDIEEDDSDSESDEEERVSEEAVDGERWQWSLYLLLLLLSWWYLKKIL